MNLKKRLTIRIPDELNAILTDKARETGISKNSLILQILWEKAKKEAINK